MSAQRDAVKPWFQTGDYPNQAQFYQWLDWLRFKDELLEIAEINGLVDILNQLAQPIETFIIAGPLTYTIPSGWLLRTIIVVPFADCSPYCSTEGGAPGDIIPVDDDTIVTPAEGAVWEVNKLAAAADRNIVLSGLPNGSKVIFIKRKLS